MVSAISILPLKGRWHGEAMMEGKPDCASLRSIARTRFPSTTPLRAAVPLPGSGRM